MIDHLKRTAGANIKDLEENHPPALINSAQSAEKTRHIKG
jgi:hypothetical protein